MSDPSLQSHQDQQLIQTKKKCARKTLDDFGWLKGKRLEIFSLRYQLVCLLDNGVPVKEAIDRLNLILTQSAARKLYRRYREHGLQALVDGRWMIEHENSVLTEEVKHRLLQWYFARPAAGYSAIHSLLERDCAERGWRTPSYESVKKFFGSLPTHYKQLRAGKLGIKEWKKQSRPVVRHEDTTYSNERWQVDHTNPPIWARTKVGNEWVPCRIWVSPSLDEHSRSIPGVVVSSRTSDSWTSSLLLMKAVLPKENPEWINKGLPIDIKRDRGSDFMSDHFVSMMARLKIRPIANPPGNPDSNGKLERWNRTLNTACLQRLPGHMDAIGCTIEAAYKNVHLLLTVPQIRKEIERWIVEEYHQRVHSETNRKPAKLWEETVRLKMPDDEDVFNLCLLKDDEVRVIGNTGIKFCPPEMRGSKGKYRYWSPEMTCHVGRKVRVCYNPEDALSVLLRCADLNEIVCEAWLMNVPDARYGIEDVKQARNNFLRGMRERIRMYRREIENEDRRSQQQVWAEARRLVEEQEAGFPHRDAETAPSDPQDDEVEAYIELLERIAAGEDVAGDERTAFD